MKRPIHVALNAHLLSGEASYRSAGIHGYILNTLRCLPGIDPDLRLTAFVSKGVSGLPHGLEARRSSFSTANPLLRILWEQCAAPFALAQARPDVVHGMGFSLPVVWHGVSVVTIYDMSFVRYPARLSMSRQLYLRVATRLSARQARRVIAISESGKAEIALLLGVPLDHIDVALPGVSDKFQPSTAVDVRDFREREGLPERYILYVGTLEPRKNLDTLLRAYAQLPSRPKVKLVLAGATGWQTSPFFRLLDDLELKDHVILPGFVPNDQLPMWYSAAEVFVYPSLYEGFGLPLLEAMACGTPVIAANTTSLPEAVGDAGLLVAPLNPSAWADALESLVTDPRARADFSRRGPERARHFSWENTARQTALSYHRALGTAL
jgi:glycosyltransferase involved in cell wall biosynthesis